jgi:putative transposase
VFYLLSSRYRATFFSDGDRWRFLSLFREYSQDCGLELLAYCLMTNHLHLVVVPEHENSLAVCSSR